MKKTGNDSIMVWSLDSREEEGHEEPLIINVYS